MISQQPTLPFEIINEILRQLPNSRDDTRLLMCSLVSHSFLITSRYHLFSEITLNPTELCSFLRLLDDSWSSIAPVISRMTIQGSNPSYRFLRPLGDGLPSFYSPKYPDLIAQHLQQVRSVQFLFVSLRSISPSFWRLLHNLKDIKKLEVHHMIFKSPEDFFGLVYELPMLQSLSIVRPHWNGKGDEDLRTSEWILNSKEGGGRNGDESHVEERQRFCIPVLDLGRTSQRKILDWLVAQNPVPPVHTFRVDLANSNIKSGYISRFINLTGEGIQHLQLQLSEGFCGDIEFTACRNLKSIRIEGLTIGDLIRPTHSCETEKFLRRTLGGLSFPHLTQITLSYTMVSYDATALGIPDSSLLQAHRWGRVSDILECHRDRRDEPLPTSALKNQQEDHEYPNNAKHNRKLELKIEIHECSQFLHLSTRHYLSAGPFAAWCQEGNGSDTFDVEFTTKQDSVPSGSRRSDF